MNTTKKLCFYVLALIVTTIMLSGSFIKDDDDNKGQQITGVVDADGNVYSTVVIGNQEWMAENLRTTKFNNGTSIPTGHTDQQWTASSTGAYTIYPHTSIDGLNSDTEVLIAYGALYNWYAIETANLCPTDWRVPTDAEWTTLTDYLGGANNAGGKLKSTRTVPEVHPGWSSPNTCATDEYGFSALPGGARYLGSGTVGEVGLSGSFWWSSTEHDATTSWGRRVAWGLENVDRNFYSKGIGFSVRCIRNNVRTEDD